VTGYETKKNAKLVKTGRDLDHVPHIGRVFFF